MKLIVDLEVVDEWPPVAAESIWLERTDSGYQLKTIPFFISGIAYDDFLDIEIFSETHGAIKSVTVSSGNSTVWAYFREGVNELRVLSRLSEIGIGCEGGALTGYYALNVPADKSLADLKKCIEVELTNGLAELAYGVCRH